MSDLDDLDELSSLVSKDDPKNTASRVRRAMRRGRPNAIYAGEEVAVSSSTADKKGKGNEEMWAVYGGNNFSACETAVTALPPGQYTVNANDSIGIYFHKETVNLDELMVLPDSKSAEVISEIERFWKLEKKFRQFGFLWKRGVMLWGPPGSGKTSTLQIISKNIVDMDGVSIYVTNPDLTARALKSLRQVEPNRPIVIMLEDIDAIIEEHGEADLLALMDGELQIDNVVFVATTNYPERLDKRFVNRPSRFDIVKKIGMPTAAARKVYLKAKNSRLAKKENAMELQQWIDESKSFSIAHLKELIISIEVFGQSLSVAATRLRKMGNLPSSGSPEKAFGFTSGDDDDRYE